MAHELPFIAAIDEAIRLEMERDDTVLYFGQNMATTENEPYVDAFGKDRVRVTPISETAAIGMAIGAAHRGVPAGGRALHGGVHARRDGPGDQRGAALPRDERRPGEGAGRVEGRVTGSPPAGRGSTPARSAVCSGRPRPEGGHALDGRRCEGPDGDGDPRRQSGRLLHHYLLTLERGASPTASTWCRSARLPSAEPGPT